MRRNQDDVRIKKVSQTFSIPVDVSSELHVYVKRREMSRFVSEAIRKELEAKKNEMRKQFSGMKNDPAEREVMKDWESTIGDGIGQPPLHKRRGLKGNSQALVDQGKR